MTIRAAILRAFLTLVVGTILLSGALSFHEFRESLQAEIARNLRMSAGALLGAGRRLFPRAHRGRAASGTSSSSWRTSASAIWTSAWPACFPTSRPGMAGSTGFFIAPTPPGGWSPPATAA